MRLIGIFKTEDLAKRFSFYLKKEGVDNTLDAEIKTEKENFAYQVWVHNEDRITFALEEYKHFCEDPQNTKYDAPPEPMEGIEEVKENNPQNNSFLSEKPEGQRFFHYGLTSLFFSICALIFFINFFQEMTIKKKENIPAIVLLTPIQYYLLFDVPHVLIKLDALIKKYHIDLTKPIKEQPPAIQKELTALDDLPFWKGFYDMFFVKKGKDKKPFPPLFEKIRQGQVWRIITPCFLHKGFLHIIFNMLWLWVLGKQMEERISRWKYLLFVLIVGAISNISQYLMSGPYFLGFSGVIMGMVGFIWVRQKIAPWEGYPLPKATVLFLLFFILAMLGLQIFSFFFELAGRMPFSPNIANTAHIAGAIVGAILGRFSFFSWRPIER